MIKLREDFFKLDYIIDKLVNMSQSDHMTESNDSDHIDKLVDMSWSDHMTVQNENENSVNKNVVYRQQNTSLISHTFS